jgi:quercetin dioxygenase-like cupin family protein
MIISHIKEVNEVHFQNEAYKNVVGRVLVSPKEGWDGYVMRHFVLGKDGSSANHNHDYPHIVYVLEGMGELHLEGEVHILSGGSFMLIPNNAQHQLINTATDGTALKFICIVPEEGHLGFE